MDKQFKFDGKRCPQCNTDLKRKQTIDAYLCEKCNHEYFPDEVKIYPQKPRVVGITKKGKLVIRNLPDLTRDYNPPKLRRKE